MLQNVTAGQHEIFLQYAWPGNSNATAPNDIAKDFTVRVYAAERVEIKDSNGKINEPYSHDYNYWPAAQKAIAD